MPRKEKTTSINEKYSTPEVVSEKDLSVNNANSVTETAYVVKGDNPKGDSDNSDKNSSASIQTKEKVVIVKPENPNSLKSKIKRFFRKIAGKLVIALILIIIGVAVGAILYPKVNQWLIDHNFVKVEQGSNTNTNSDGNGTQPFTFEGVTEEQAIVSAVNNAKDSVVSIALENLSLTTDGLTDSSNKIGTGFIVDASGIIITNQHVVSRTDSKYVVITADGKEYKVEQIVRDPNNDIAVIKVKAENLKALSLGDSDKLLPGQFVIAIGTPLGEYAGSVTVGVISGLNRNVKASSGSFWSSPLDYENVIQTDAAINPGNSGGPLLNTKGEVIGINFATTSGADNISFALPINVAKNRLEEFRKYGKFLRPMLGVKVYAVISDLEARYYKNVVAGAIIEGVVTDSPAEKAGLKRADIITKINGEKVTGSLANMIAEYKIGDEIKVEYWRSGETKEVTVKLVEAD